MQTGNATVGSVSAAGLYTAPSTVPTPFTVTVTATSAADSTKSASAPIIVAGTIASVQQTISAATGGTITLPDGSSVTIPANVLTVDQIVTLSELSVLSQQAPNQLVAGVGPTLQVNLSTPLPGNALRNQARAPRRPARPLQGASTNASEITFSISEQAESAGLNGGVGIANMVDTSGNTDFLATSYALNPSGPSAALSLTTSWLQSTAIPVSSFGATVANTTLQIFPNLPIVTLPADRCWDTNDPNNPQWANLSACTSKIAGKRVLVLVHGMMSCVEQMTPLAAWALQGVGTTTSSNYDVVVGFDYDWTEGLTASATPLTNFLDQLAQMGPQRIDVLAHSEGVPVSLYAAAQASNRNLIVNFVGLAGPILGTPVASDSDLVLEGVLWAFAIRNSISCPASIPYQFNDLPGRPFRTDLVKNSDVLTQTILPEARKNLSATRLFLAGGTYPYPLVLFNSSDFGATPNDGVVGLDSALGFNSKLNTFLLPPFPLFHSDYTNAQKNGDVLRDLANQIAHSPSRQQNTLPELNCENLEGGCTGQQDSSFLFSGNGFSPDLTNIEVFSQDSTGGYQQLNPLEISLQDTSGQLTWTLPDCFQSPGSFSIFAFDGTLAANDVMQTVYPGDCSASVSVAISPETVAMQPGATQSFSATVVGTSNTSVAWSIWEQATGGTISNSGIYTAPTTEGTYHVVATSQVDSTANATARVTVSSSANSVPSILSLSPSSLAQGAPPQSLTINGTGFLTTSSVTFNGIPHPPTFVSASELSIFLTSIDLGTVGNFLVIASNPPPGGGPSKAATLSVTSSISGTVTISPALVSVQDGGVQTFSGSVAGGGSVIWSVLEGASGGSITSAGIYTAPQIAGTFHVISTNAADSSQSATASVSVVSAIPYTLLHLFGNGTGADPVNPSAALLQTTDGSFYGTTEYGPQHGSTVFKIDSAGSYSSLGYVDSAPAAPTSSLVATSDGNLYGTSANGGSSTSCTPTGFFYLDGCGVVFKVDQSGAINTLHSFSGKDGAFWPFASLLLGSDGNFYGTTFAGGVLTCGTIQPLGSGLGCGTVFKMDRAGNLVVLYAFSGADGAYPTVPLIQASDGYFYGTTSGGVSVHESANLPLRAGMSSSLGTVFRIDSSGNLTTLHSFSGRDGASPNASLLQGSDGFLYGTTSGGGSAGMGTVFRLDTTGNFTVLHSFAGPDGDDPVAGLIQATDGSFYGTTWTGGDLTCSIDYDFQNYPFPFNLGCGTVFRMDQSGNVTVLHAFEFAPTDGSGPAAGVVQGSDGNLYGTTFYGGNVFFGVVFRIDPSALLPSALPQRKESNSKAP